MFTKLQMVEDQELERRVGNHFNKQISILEDEGFERLGTFETRHSPWIAPAAWAFASSGKEVWSHSPRFHINWYHPLLKSADGQTLAYPFGLGIIFYTFFEDGSTIRTSNSEGETVQLPDQQIDKNYVSGFSEGETWLYHLAYCEQRKAAGQRVSTEGMVEKFLDVQVREDRVQDYVFLAGLSWGVPAALMALMGWALLT